MQNDKDKALLAELRSANGLHHDNGMRKVDRRDLIEEIDEQSGSR